MKKWITLLVLIGAGYVGYVQWQAWQTRVKAEAVSSRPTTAPVIVTNINFAVNAAGTIGPAEQVSVRPQVNGIIKTMPVDIGDAVKKGASLFTLDDQDLQTQLSTKLIDIEAKKIELEKAERDFNRSQELYTSKLISQELYDDTKTAYALARNTVDQKLKELHLIEYQITLTKIIAPFDCTILTRPVSIGQAVSGSGGFNSGTEVLTIADLNSMIIDAHVNQADVPRLKVGQPVDITVEAVPGLQVAGVIERIAPQATIVNNIKGFAARILLKDVDLRVRPGMTANVRVPVASVSNVTAVPLAAVFTEKSQDSDEMERFVYVQKGEAFEKRNVHVGVADYFFAEIQSGLTGTETVALEIPKEEREKQAKAMAGGRTGVEGGGSGRGNSRTNTRPAAVGVAPAGTNAPATTNAPRATGAGVTATLSR